jgi:hypothetical protein
MSLDQALGLPRILDGAESWSASIDGTQLVHLKAEIDGIEMDVQIATHPRGS